MAWATEFDDAVFQKLQTFVGKEVIFSTKGQKRRLRLQEIRALGSKVRFDCTESYRELTYRAKYADRSRLVSFDLDIPDEVEIKGGLIRLTYFRRDYLVKRPKKGYTHADPEPLIITISLALEV